MSRVAFSLLAKRICPNRLHLSSLRRHQKSKKVLFFRYLQGLGLIEPLPVSLLFHKACLSDDLSVLLLSVLVRPKQLEQLLHELSELLIPLGPKGSRSNGC